MECAEVGNRTMDLKEVCSCCNGLYTYIHTFVMYITYSFVYLVTLLFLPYFVFSIMYVCMHVGELVL